MLSEDSRKLNGLFCEWVFMLKGNNICKSHVTHYPFKIHIYVYVCMRMHIKKDDNDKNGKYTNYTLKFVIQYENR